MLVHGAKDTVVLIDLNTPLAKRPDLFAEADGVHPNQAGYLAVAELVAKALRDSLELSAEKSAQAGSQ
jgi:lysophospholipase L1-like esterase